MRTITFKGQALNLSGIFPQKGTKAPPFELVDQNLKEVTLSSLGSKRKLLNVFISLDTSVCAKSIHAFASKWGTQPNLIILNISMDLPFAADRFCQAEKLDNAITLSAFRSSFPQDYGVKIVDGPLKGLCARAVFVLGEDNTILYSELVPEITQEPDYQSAAEILKVIA